MSGTRAIILIGASGSGKSTWAKQHTRTRANRPWVTVSADNYFIGANGYDFDPSKLGKAHGASLRVFVEAMSQGWNAICDNTNTTIAEVAPYLAIAQAYDAEIKILRFGATVDECVDRNVHGVPPNVIRRQFKNIDRMVSNWPSFWPEIAMVHEGETKSR